MIEWRKQTAFLNGRQIGGVSFYESWGWVAHGPTPDPSFRKYGEPETNGYPTKEEAIREFERRCNQEGLVDEHHPEYA